MNEIPETNKKSAQLEHCVSTKNKTMMGFMISNMGPLYEKIRKNYV